jgi:predicted Rossmann fold flavoprotein
MCRKTSDIELRVDSSSENYFDVIIVGAGSAGMMCAFHAAQRHRKVLLVEHMKSEGGKISISGGGRCNFTNIGTSPENFVSENPHFCKSALSRYKPEAFLELIYKHKIPFYEKKLGQLFCKNSARDIVEMLKYECKEAGVITLLGLKIHEVSKIEESNELRFSLNTSRGTLKAHSLVVATGGLSIPKLGSTGWGYQIAQQFNIKVTETHPALDGFIFDKNWTKFCSQLSGLSLDCELSISNKCFRENILFTHKGLSGPAALQGSLHWNKGKKISINLDPDSKLLQLIHEKRNSKVKGLLKNLLVDIWPSRFSESFCELNNLNETAILNMSDKQIEKFVEAAQNWELTPIATVGYDKAEVTRGGVDTSELSSKTMEAKKVPGLFFIGEVVDVTGWLGGYNFQWAWASAWAAAQAL